MEQELLLRVLSTPYDNILEVVDEFLGKVPPLPHEEGYFVQTHHTTKKGVTYDLRITTSRYVPGEDFKIQTKIHSLMNQHGYVVCKGSYLFSLRVFYPQKRIEKLFFELIVHIGYPSVCGRMKQRLESMRGTKNHYICYSDQGKTHVGAIRTVLTELHDTFKFKRYSCNKTNLICAAKYGHYQLVIGRVSREVLPVFVENPWAFVDSSLFTE